ALYSLIAASGYRVWRSGPSPERTLALAFLAAQLGLGAAWPLLLFRQRAPKAALTDIGLLRMSIDAYVEAAEKIDPAARWMVAPYRGVIGLATLFNGAIVRQDNA